MQMSVRERFVNIMSYKKADALPVMFFEPFEGFTLDEWRKQGLPMGTTPEAYLGLDTAYTLPISLMPMPMFPRTILEDAPDYYIETDYMGSTVKRKKEAPRMFYGHLAHPVTDRDSFLRYKERFVANSARYMNGLDDIVEEANKSQSPVSLFLFPFFMRLGFYSMGMEQFLMNLYDEPDLIHEMFDFWVSFAIDVFTPVLERVTPDVVSFAEDIAFKNGPHVSPDLYKEFWLPHQNRIMSVIKNAGIPFVSMYTSGDIRPLLPLLLDNGFNMTWPLDQYSNMDPYALRREYGKELRLAGGISKDTLANGPDAIDRRIDELLPLIQEGGFIPAPDDIVPPEIPLANCKYLVEKLREIRL